MEHKLPDCCDDPHVKFNSGNPLCLNCGIHPFKKPIYVKLPAMKEPDCGKPSTD